jgi:molybdenum cofactor cytidylyltransferase
MISAIILAAGQSKRMGQPKMLLPWGNRTIIEQVVTTFLQAGIEDILVVTGGAHTQLEKAIERLPIRKVHNPDYMTGEMLSSLQCGMREMAAATQAALIGLGDQPQLQASSVRLICDRYKSSKSNLVVPSFNKKRGHPWLVSRSLWGEVLALKPSETLRDFLNGHADEIQYVNMDTPTVLADLDTPEDYEKSRP